MSFGEYIASQFPGIKWTGQSPIHRSLAGTFGIAQDFGTIEQAMTAAHVSSMGSALWTFLLDRFHNMDWQVAPEEFHAIILTDVYRHLNHEGDTKTGKKIRNPHTGNVFHILATKGDIVGGVRIWKNGDGNSLDFGFRFRLAGMNEQEKFDAPITARQKALSSVKLAKNIVEKLKIPEPNEEEVKKMRKKVYVK